MSKIGIYPGTFDPMTNGHLNIIQRSLKVVDKLIIGVADNLNKKPLLSIDERKNIVSDFEYEFQMTGMNYQLNPKIETIFLMSADNNSFISSNLVKEVHKLGGDVSKFVSENTIKILNNKNTSS